MSLFGCTVNRFSQLLCCLRAQGCRASESYLYMLSKSANRTEVLIGYTFRTCSMHVLVTGDSGFLKVSSSSPFFLPYICPTFLLRSWWLSLYELPANNTFPLSFFKSPPSKWSLFPFLVSSHLQYFLPHFQNPTIFFSLPTSAFLSLSLCIFVLLSWVLFCKVFTGISQPDSL